MKNDYKHLMEKLEVQLEKEVKKRILYIEDHKKQTDEILTKVLKLQRLKEDIIDIVHRWRTRPAKTPYIYLIQLEHRLAEECV